MERVVLTAIAFDAGTQIREAINESVVADYADRMTEGAQFPPVVLFHDGNRYYLADGFHRYMAAQRNGFVDIDADVRAGTREDALWFALGANKANGHRMTAGDKRHAIVLALKTWPEKSVKQIAEQIGVNQGYASTIRNQVIAINNLPDRVTGKDGKSYPASRTPAARDLRKEQIAEMVRDGKSNVEINAAIGAKRDDIIAEVRRELGVAVADKSQEAVAQRRKDVRELAERGYSTRQIAQKLACEESTVRAIAKQEDIAIHADSVTSKTRRHDATRIIEHIVIDAENLTADVHLIDFDALDGAQIAGWLKSLNDSRDKLGAFIRRLMKEQQKHGEAA